MREQVREKILSELIKKKITLKSICVFEKPDGSFEAEAEFYDEEDMETAQEMLSVVSQVLGQPMRMAGMPGDALKVLLGPLLNFKIVSELRPLKRRRGKKNGDTCCALSER